jgi:hypothetical protein
VCAAVSQAVTDVQGANQANGTSFQLEVGPDENLGWPTLESWQKTESTPWQVDVRADWPACASGTSRYHIMSQSLESRWDNTDLGAIQGSESDFDNYLTQTVLQANAAGIPSSAVTAGLGANDRYNVTPQQMYQDTLDTQAAFGSSPLVSGYWLNAPSSAADIPVALQYLEMLDGTVPLYLQKSGGTETLTQSFPEGKAASTETVQPGTAHQLTWVDTANPLPVGTVIPAAATSPGASPPDDGYRVQLFCADSQSSCQAAKVNISVGMCVQSGGVCTSNKTVLASAAGQRLPSSTQASFGSAIFLPPGSAKATTVTAKNEAFYTTVQNTSTSTPIDLYDYGDNCIQGCPKSAVDVPAAVAVPRPVTPSPSTWTATANSSLLVPTNGGGLSVGLPGSQSGNATFSLAKSGSRTYTTPWTTSKTQGPIVVPAGAAQVQTTATDNNSGASESAVLSVKVGYCTTNTCTWPNGNSTSALVEPGTAAAAPDGSGAFTMAGFTIPVGASLAVQLSVQTPGAVTVDLGGTQPTNIATTYEGPSG